ncbi:thioredoxin domain-containing protein [Flavitalea sp.]|nr:thioredoxin domain-containing protein [Flavitalea sp.]
MPNRLQHESSPYLLQHANNPVDWYPWSEEAFEKAIKEDKPVLVSIGYAACHWCHVMERESFENHETAALMNECYINIKIDREERPDLDHIYMDAVQAMTGSGGWPLNVFLTPQKKPFYGGTYFPPQQVHSRPSWKDVLVSLSDSYKNQRAELEKQAENLLDHMLKANSFGVGKQSSEKLATKQEIRAIYENVMKTADRVHGGFGRAPKFPQTFTIRFLLHYYHHTKEQEALDQALLSLDKMIFGGINDQLGGGFSRYSTDTTWLAPHFEKMLYDNALLIVTLAEAYQITGKKLYRDTINQTIQFVDNELTGPDTGFYSALDADSEGIEGKFYTWSYDEINYILDTKAALFCLVYGVVPGGNWEQTNILHLPKNIETVAATENIGVEELEKILADCRKKLMELRSERVRPQLDDKMLIGWNALMNIALSKAAAATSDKMFLRRAISNMEFMLQAYRQEDGSFAHTYKNNISKYPAFLDDYAYLISALIHLQEVTANQEWLNIAKSLTNFVIGNFGQEGPLFFYTQAGQKDVIIRKKEVYDGATPSGNSMMMWNLYQLGTIFDISEWKSRSIEMAASVQETVVKYPGSFGVWAGFLLSSAYGIPEIAITGQESTVLSIEFLRNFIGYNVFQSATLSNNDFPLLTEKPFSQKGQIFLCKDYACQAPVQTVAELVNLLENR